MRSPLMMLAIGVVLVAGMLPAQAARSIRAIYFQRPAGAPEKVYLYGGKKVLEVPLPGMNLSPRQKLPGGALVLRCLPEPLAEGQEMPENAPVVTVAEDCSDVILLFAVNPGSKEFPFQVVALDASASRFKPGEMLCFNRTNHTLGGQIGSRKVRIDPGKTKMIKPPAVDLSDYRVMIDYLPPGGKRALPLSRTTWRYEPMVRHLLFVVQDTKRKVPRIWSIPDRLPPPEEPGKGS